MKENINEIKMQKNINEVVMQKIGMAVQENLSEQMMKENSIDVGKEMK